MKTILQIEDDANDAFFFQRAMKKNNTPNPIHVARDGREAIDYLKGDGKYADRELFPLPGLVLLDLKLPHIMGLDVLKWIRQECDPSLVVVVLTSSSDGEDMAAAYGGGANGFLIKPTDPAKLEDMVKAISHFWLMHNALPAEPLPARAPEVAWTAWNAQREATVLATPPGLRPCTPRTPAYQTPRALSL
jgi:DNA-binding response OmpR family regulator